MQIGNLFKRPRRALIEVHHRRTTDMPLGRFSIGLQASWLAWTDPSHGATSPHDPARKSTSSAIAAA